MSEENKMEQALDQLEAGETPQAPVDTLANQDPEEVAAMLLKEFSPRYKKAIYELTTGEARRLNIALCTYPLENEHIMDANDKLMQTYVLGCRLMEAKQLLTNAFLFRKYEEEQKKLNEEQTDGK